MSAAEAALGLSNKAEWNTCSEHMASRCMCASGQFNVFYVPCAACVVSNVMSFVIHTQLM